MGTDDYFVRMADEALAGFATDSEEQLKRLRRQVYLVLKEVERDTRHRCAEVVNECHGNVMNSRPV